MAHDPSMPLLAGTPSESCSRAVLLLPLSTLDVPLHYASAISAAVAATQTAVTIVLQSPIFDRTNTISHTGSWDSVQRLVTFVYVQASRVAQSMDKVLMAIDVLLKAPGDTLEEVAEVDRIFRIDGAATVTPPSLASLPAVELTADAISHVEHPNPSVVGALLPSYPVVALGGTFDHLHPGHKILLSMAAWIASEKIVVGVTDDALLKNKSNRHLLESLPQRMERVRAFLARFKPGIVYQIVPISDVYGPTGWDSNIQALVVSTETVAGSELISRHREENSLPPLQTFVIDVISADSTALSRTDMELLREAKMSSTAIRQWIAERQ